MEFLLIAYDGTDDTALNRRMEAREQHLAYARKLYQEGTLIKGGAFINKEGQMIGSTIMYQAESVEALQKIVDKDPYMTNGVWVDVKIKPIRLANLD